jgi:eukaryotic-like serine/threonine-protein kinase
VLKPGDTFERYTIEAPLGQGGMGYVYRAADARLGRRVALKVISERIAASDASARLVREARAAAALDHPNAVAVFDVGEAEGTPFIVMELVEGKTLRDAIGGSTALDTRIGWLADAGRALGAAHKRGLVHRDVKPENVMIRDDGVVKVLDFGIARRDSVAADPAAPTQSPALPTLTMEGVKLGTPLYMAPEQIRGDPLDGRADQFSWAVVAYELFTGRLPWRGTDALAAMASVLTDPIDAGALEAAGVPGPVRRVVLRALSRRPEDRFATMEEAVAALEAAAEGEEPDPGATAAQKFSTTEVRDVLAKAVERQAAMQASTKLGFADLLAVAAEVGIDPESLREASRAVRSEGQVEATAAADAKRRDAWLRRRRRDFRRHLGVYSIVNAGLLVLGLVLLAMTPWWVWFLPALGWGIGLAIHGLVALTSNEDDWAEHEQAMRWWEEGRRRRHEERMARRGRGGKRDDKARIEVGARIDEPKVRVADTPAPEEAGETHTEERPAQRRRR